MVLTPVHVEIVILVLPCLSSSGLVLSLAVIVSHSSVRYLVFLPVYLSCLCPIALLQSRTSLYVNVGNRLLILFLYPFL